VENEAKLTEATKNRSRNISLADGILQEQDRVNSLQMKTLEYRRRIQETESDIKEG